MKALLNKIYNLKFIIRYSNVQRIHNESVAEHSYFVSIIVLLLSEKYNFNVEQALKMALVHDVAESDIDDLSWVVKQAYPEVAASLKQAELEVIKTYPKCISEPFIDFESGSENVESLIVKLADIISVAQYSENEMMLGNTSYMSDVFDSSQSRVKELERKLINYKKK